MGTICRIKTTKKKEGFLRVTFVGNQRASIIRLSEDERMLFATVKPEEDIRGDSLEEMALVRQIAKGLEQITNVSQSFPPEVFSQLTKGVSADQLADQVAQYFPMNLDERQGLLEELVLNQRLLLIISNLKKEKELTNIEQGINEKVRERIEENQREYYLREKLRAIKEELGDLLFYMSNLMQSVGLSFKDVLQHNIDKLSVRYASGKYSNEQAQQRADKLLTGETE